MRISVEVKDDDGEAHEVIYRARPVDPGSGWDLEIMFPKATDPEWSIIEAAVARDGGWDKVDERAAEAADQADEDSYGDD